MTVRYEYMYRATPTICNDRSQQTGDPFAALIRVNTVVCVMVNSGDNQGEPQRPDSLQLVFSVF